MHQCRCSFYIWTTKRAGDALWFCFILIVVDFSDSSVYKLLYYCPSPLPIHAQMAFSFSDLLLTVVAQMQLQVAPWKIISLAVANWQNLTRNRLKQTQMKSKDESGWLWDIRERRASGCRGAEWEQGRCSTLPNWVNCILHFVFRISLCICKCCGVPGLKCREQIRYFALKLCQSQTNMSVNYYRVLSSRKKSIITMQNLTSSKKKRNTRWRKLPLDLPHGNLNKATICYVFSLFDGFYRHTHRHTQTHADTDTNTQVFIYVCAIVFQWISRSVFAICV